MGCRGGRGGGAGSKAKTPEVMCRSGLSCIGRAAQRHARGFGTQVAQKHAIIYEIKVNNRLVKFRITTLTCVLASEPRRASYSNTLIKNTQTRQSLCTTESTCLHSAPVFPTPQLAPSTRSRWRSRAGGAWSESPGRSSSGGCWAGGTSGWSSRSRWRSPGAEALLRYWMGEFKESRLNLEATAARLRALALNLTM